MSDDDTSEESIASPLEVQDLHELASVDDRKESLNTYFGFTPWKGTLRSRDISERSLSSKRLYSPLSGVFDEAYLQSYWNKIGNAAYVVLFGWWICLIYFIVGLLCYATIICSKHGRTCFVLAKYFFYPFGKFVERAEDETERTATSTVVWSVLLAPILVFTHTICLIVTWFSIIFISTLQFQSIRLLYNDFTNITVADDFPTQTDSDIILCLFQSCNMHYYRYQVFGMAVILFNMLPLSIVTIISGYTLGAPFVTRYSIFIFIVGLLSIIPLGYATQKAISSFSVQTTVGFGAFINSMFSSMVDIILYTLSLQQDLETVVLASFTGHLFATTLLMPGLCMLIGGIKHKRLKHNKDAINVSSTLIFMSIVGAFLPTVFYQIKGKYSLNCDRCESSSSLKCVVCLFIEKNYRNDAIYQRDARILMYMCAILLPLAYGVGLVYSLHTHRDHIHRNSIRKRLTQSMYVTTAQWGRVTCICILFFCAVFLGLDSRVISTSLRPAFNKLNVNIEYAGLILFPLFTLFPKLVTAIEFALANDVTKSLELCNLATLQVALIQMPFLCLITGILALFNIYAETQTFTFIFPSIQMYTVTIASVVLCYVLIEGSVNSTQGAYLVLLYFVIMATFYVKYL